jgi:hypothetical protein
VFHLEIPWVAQSGGIDDHFFFEKRVEAVFATYWQGIIGFKGQEHLCT